MQDILFIFIIVSDLSNIVFASRSGRMSVKQYLSSSVCTQLCNFRNPHPPNAPDNFVDVKGHLDYYSQVGMVALTVFFCLGILFRRIYCFLPLSLRIQFLDSILQAVSTIAFCILKLSSYAKYGLCST